MKQKLLFFLEFIMLYGLLLAYVGLRSWIQREADLRWDIEFQQIGVLISLVLFFGCGLVLSALRNSMWKQQGKKNFVSMLLILYLPALIPIVSHVLITFSHVMIPSMLLQIGSVLYPHCSFIIGCALFDAFVLVSRRKSANL